MRDPKRINVVLRKIKKIWEQNPDMRLGQLIGNVVDESAIYFIEDDDLVKHLELFYDPEEVFLRAIKTYVEENGLHYSNTVIKSMWEDFSHKWFASFLIPDKHYLLEFMKYLKDPDHYEVTKEDVE